jgi:hypothetical protein
MNNVAKGSLVSTRNPTQVAVLPNCAWVLVAAYHATQVRRKHSDAGGQA